MIFSQSKLSYYIVNDISLTKIILIYQIIYRPTLTWVECFLFLESFYFCDLGAHTKLQNCSTTPSGRIGTVPVQSGYIGSSVWLYNGSVWLYDSSVWLYCRFSLVIWRFNLVIGCNINSGLPKFALRSDQNLMLKA